MNLTAMRARFDKSEEVDAANRARIVKLIKDRTDVVYSAEENKIIEDGLENFNMFQGQKAKKFDMSLKTVEARLAYKTGDALAWGWASTVVRANQKEALAFMWDTEKKTSRRSDDLERSVDETPNDHNQLVYLSKKRKKPLQDREFLTRILWKETENGDFVYVTREAESRRRKKLDGVVRATYMSVMKITRISAVESKIEYIARVDAGGSLPDFIANKLMRRNLARLSDMQKFFQSLRRLGQWDAGDGKAVGEIMVVKTEQHRVKGETTYDARMREMLEKYKGLKEIGAKYDFMEGMLARVVQNHLRSARDVSTNLCNVSKMEGRMIGAGLAISLASSLTAEAAVDEWIGKYPALKELDKEEVWFRPMMNTVAIRLLGEVSWGLKMRVFMGAGLSVLDMVSDINVILLYMSDSDTKGYAMFLVGMIATCVGLQLIATFVLHHKKPLTRLMGELLIVLTGLKPG
jgi:hypothetical protein